MEPQKNLLYFLWCTLQLNNDTLMTPDTAVLHFSLWIIYLRRHRPFCSCQTSVVFVLHCLNQHQLKGCKHVRLYLVQWRWFVPPRPADGPICAVAMFPLKNPCVSPLFLHRSEKVRSSVWLDCLLIIWSLRDKGSPLSPLPPTSPHTPLLILPFVICIKGCKETAEVYFVSLNWVHLSHVGNPCLFSRLFVQFLRVFIKTQKPKTYILPQWIIPSLQTQHFVILVHSGLLKLLWMICCLVKETSSSLLKTGVLLFWFWSTHSNSISHKLFTQKPCSVASLAKRWQHRNREDWEFKKTQPCS